MKYLAYLYLSLALAFTAVAATACAPAPPEAVTDAVTDLLPLWSEDPARRAIIEFVRATTDESSTEFVPPANRIATFDNDGTLWPSHAGMSTAEFESIVNDWLARARHPRFK